MKFMSNKKFTGAIQPRVEYLEYIIPDLPPLLYGIIWDMSIYKVFIMGQIKKYFFVLALFLPHLYVRIIP